MTKFHAYEIRVDLNNNNNNKHEQDTNSVNTVSLLIYECGSALARIWGSPGVRDPLRIFILKTMLWVFIFYSTKWIG